MNQLPLSRFKLLLDFLAAHGYHLLFTLTLVALAALIAWWSVFIRGAINLQHQHSYELLQQRAQIAALTLGTDGGLPSVGSVPGDDQLEIVRSDGSTRPVAVPVKAWPGYCVSARVEDIAEIERHFTRQLHMILGESTFMVLIIIVSSFMLYRLIYVERRATKQLHEFWSRLTHELKTPLTGIKAFLQTLQKRDFTREELAPLVGMALREVERQEMLAGNLLVGQRVEREGFGVKLLEFNLPHNVSAFFAEHGILFPAGAFELKVECPLQRTVLGDPDALWVILENLVDNALKYGGDQPQLAVVVVDEGAQTAVRLSDRGAGFDPRNAGRIFEAYHRLMHELPAGRHGTGMGLYLSRRLARKMGGDLVADSAGPGQGATFTILLNRAGGA